VRVGAALLVLALAARAQGLAVNRDGLAMMPGLSAETRSAAGRALVEAERRLKDVARRRADVERALKANPAPAGNARTKLVQERARLTGQAKAIAREFYGKLDEAGLGPDDVDRLRRMPRGALREQAYNHSVVLEAPDLSIEQERLLTDLVAAADAAQLALLTQENRFKQTLREEDDALRRRLLTTFAQQRGEIERRFWRVVFYALEPRQMSAARELLSPRYRAVSDLQRQLLLLPDLSASQGNRIQARFAEHESETAADRAEVQLLRARLADRTLAADARQALQTRQGAAYRRLAAMNEGLADAIRALLTPEQLDALHAVPPTLSSSDRLQPPQRYWTEIAQRVEQSERLTALTRELDKERREVAQEGRETQAAMGGMMKELGPESPQSMAMEMFRKNQQVALSDRMRAIGRKAFLEVLEPAQIVAWVVAPQP